jgi:hypothetical protein
MKWLMALGMFAVAFLAGAGLFLATRPAPMLHALVLQLQGPGLMERCRQAGACAKLDIVPVQQPRPRELAPADMDRG